MVDGVHISRRLSWFRIVLSVFWSMSIVLTRGVFWGHTIGKSGSNEGERLKGQRKDSESELKTCENRNKTRCHDPGEVKDIKVLFKGGCFQNDYHL